VLSGKKYTLIDYFKKDADYVNNDVITGYPVISILPYNNSSMHLIPNRPYVQLHEGTMVNLADMMTAIRDINQRGYGMVSSHQLNQISAMFDQERQNQEATLAVLRQEEDELQELLDQNHKEQSQTRKNQRSLTDIDRKLKQISQETSQLSNPGPRSYQARERLMQIQRIPRSRTVPYESN
jgi:chromosome segregation ATPase